MNVYCISNVLANFQSLVDVLHPSPRWSSAADAITPECMRTVRLPYFLVGVNYNPETRNVDTPMFEAVVPAEGV